jgi:hypothetical protein
VKRNIAPLLFLLFPALLEAQTPWNIPFDSTSRWSVKESYALDPSCVTSIYYVYFIEGDTLLANRTYKKLYYNSKLENTYFGTYPYPQYCMICNTNACSGPQYQLHRYAGALRDSALKVFFFPATYTAEQVLYDFDLDLGDTLPRTLVYDSTYRVARLDTVQIGTQQRRRFFCVNDCGWPDTNTIIEGIGQEQGPITPMICFFEDIWELECYSEGGFTVYTAPNTPDCNLLVGTAGDQAQSEPGLIIFPNPVQGRLNISLPGVFNGRVNIYNLLSQQVDSRAYTGLPVDVSSLDAGIYLLEFETGSKRLTARFIKQ